MMEEENKITTEELEATEAEETEAEAEVSEAEAEETEAKAEVVGADAEVTEEVTAETEPAAETETAVVEAPEEESAEEAEEEAAAEEAATISEEAEEESVEEAAEEAATEEAATISEEAEKESAEGAEDETSDNKTAEETFEEETAVVNEPEKTEEADAAEEPEETEEADAAEEPEETGEADAAKEPEEISRTLSHGANALFTVIRIILVSALIAAIVIFVFLRNRESTVPAADVFKAVTDQITSEKMEQTSDRYFKKYYGLNAADYDDVLYYAPVSNMDAEEVLVVKLKSTDQAEAVTEAILKRQADKEQSFEGYAPEQYALTQEYILDVQANYILFVVDPEAEKIDSAFAGAL